MNYSDSERFASILEFNGFEYTSRPKDADCIIINSCSIRQKAEDRIVGLGRKMQPLKLSNPKLRIILSGCMAKRGWNNKTNSKYIDHLKKIMPWLDDIVETKEFFQNSPHSNYALIWPASAYIPVSFGCDHFCTYCIVPFARGKEVCRTFEEIKHEFDLAILHGVKNIVLLGQTVNRWRNQSSIGPQSFWELCKELDKGKGDFWLSFMSSHPNYISTEFIDFLAKSKHFRPYFHLALQSGSDKILARMNRRYNYADFKKIALYYKKRLPNATLSTDIIVGFPGETEEDFNETVKAMSELNFDMAYISEFSPRTGTAAARIPDDVSQKIKAQRKTYLNDKILAVTALNNNNKLIGSVRDCLIEKINSKFIMARLDNNKEIQISIPKSPKLHTINSFRKVKIISANPWALKGELL